MCELCGSQSCDCSGVTKNKVRLTDMEIADCIDNADKAWYEFTNALADKGLYFSKSKGVVKICESKTDKVIWEY